MMQLAGQKTRVPLRAQLGSPSVVLFLCLFAAQTSLLVVAPLLVEIARDLGISTASVGQLRTITGLVAAAGALVLGRLAVRIGLRNLLLLGTSLLIAGALVSAIAPSFLVLALAQLPTGLGIGILVTGSASAAAHWVAPEDRLRVLSRALMGPPVAWIVAQPAVGWTAASDWRLSIAAIPLSASLPAGVALLLRPPERAPAASRAGLRVLLRERAVAAWALGELFAFAAAAGTLVYAGALFAESYGASPLLTGVLLGAAATAYLPGNVLARRFVGGSVRPLLLVLALALGAISLLFATLRSGLWVSALLLAGVVFVIGARTLAGSVIGLDGAPGRRLGLAGLRTASSQLGYLVGSALGGLGLAFFGFDGLGLVLGALAAAAAVPQLLLYRAATTGRAAIRPTAQPLLRPA